MNQVQGIGTVSRQRLSKVIETSKGGFTPKDVSLALNVSRQEAGRLLSRWCKAGWLKRVKRGFYVNIPVESSSEKTAIEDPWLIASKIFGPGYIGGFSAIKHWDLSEQIFETVVFLSTKQTKSKNLRYSDITFQLKTINPAKVFGTKTIWHNSSKIQVSDPTKTFVDMFDDPQLGGGIRSVRDFFEKYMESEYKNIPLLIAYSKRMNNLSIFKRMGFLLELLGFEDKKILEETRSYISKGYSKLDPTMKNTRIVRRWNLIIPTAWANEYDRKK